MNNRGFTLVEVLAVIVIIAIIGVIAVPNIIGTINNSKSSSEKVMISNIKVGAQELFEEVDINGEEISGGKRSSLINYMKDNNGAYVDKGNVTISNNKMTVYLLTLAINGFLNGTGDSDSLKIIDSKSGKDISNCQIRVTKTVSNDGNFDVSYTFSKVGNSEICPSY